MENGGLTQSIKSLTEKVKENPNWGEGRGGSRKCGVFPHSVSFVTFDGSPNIINLAPLIAIIETLTTVVFQM